MLCVENLQLKPRAGGVDERIKKEHLAAQKQATFIAGRGDWVILCFDDVFMFASYQVKMIQVDK